MNFTKKPYLPRCVSKKELANYWGCSYKVMWDSILTDELLETLGYPYETISAKRILSPELTKKIYLHFGITDLNETLYHELKIKESTVTQ